MRVARIFNTYGPRMALDDGRVVSNFVAQALRGVPPPTRPLTCPALAHLMAEDLTAPDVHYYCTNHMFRKKNRCAQLANARDQSSSDGWSLRQGRSAVVVEFGRAPHGGRRVGGDQEWVDGGAAQDPLTVYGDGSQTRSFQFVSDLVAGLVALMEGEHTGPMNIGTHTYTPLLRARHPSTPTHHCEPRAP